MPGERCPSPSPRTLPGLPKAVLCPVDQHQVGKDSPAIFGLRGLTAVCLLLGANVGHPFEAAAEHLPHALEVVNAFHVFDPEPAVVGRFWPTVLKDHHAGNGVGPLDVRYVVALHAANRHGQA